MPSLTHLPNQASGLLSHFFPEFESIMPNGSWMTWGKYLTSVNLIWKMGVVVGTN